MRAVKIIGICALAYFGYVWGDVLGRMVREFVPQPVIYAGLGLIGIALLGLILWRLAGNKREQPADAAQLARAKAFNAPAERAGLFLIRQGFAGAGVGLDVSLNGAIVAQLKSPRFTYLEVAPGHYEIDRAFTGSKSPAGEALAVFLQPGEIHGVLFQPVTGKVRPGITHVERQHISGMIEKMKMVAPMEAAPS